MIVRCLKCGNVHGGNFCPVCGAPRMPMNLVPPTSYTRIQIILRLLVLITISGVFTFGITFLALSFIGNSSNGTVPNSTDAPILYPEYDISTMIQELHDNASAAESKYVNQYIEITGKLSNIDSDGIYISIKPLESEWSKDRILCDIQNEDQIDKVMQMSIGDTISIKGRVTSIGKTLGYLMDIDEIE